MLFLIHQQMNILSGAVILLFGVYVVSMLDKKALINKIYIASLFLNLLLVSFEIVMQAMAEAWTDSLMVKLLSCIICILFPFLSYLFLKFICSYFLAPVKLKKNVLYAFYTLLAVNSIAAVAAFMAKAYGPTAFSRYIIPFVVSLVFLAYSVYVIAVNRKLLLTFEIAYILAISIMTNAAVLVQLCMRQAAFIWCSSSFTIIMMFILIQQRELFRDSLTGARNRAVLKKCIEAYTRKAPKNLSIILVDLDYFKGINDSYGHMEGDCALKTFAKLLQRVYTDNGILIRTGGDEFVILVHDLPTSMVSDLTTKMAKMVEKHNMKGGKPYMLKYSSAFDTYKNDVSIEQFIHEIDLKMYKHKNRRKRVAWAVEREY